VSGFFVIPAERAGPTDVDICNMVLTGWRSLDESIVRSSFNRLQGVGTHAVQVGQNSDDVTHPEEDFTEVANLYDVELSPDVPSVCTVFAEQNEQGELELLRRPETLVIPEFDGEALADDREDVLSEPSENELSS